MIGRTPAAEEAARAAVRGLLILIVMLDHNDLVRGVRSVNAWFLPMTFHVAGFLLLPFLGAPKRLSWPMVRDHAARYLVPFAAAVLGYAILFEALASRRPAGEFVGALAAALVFADPWSLQAATGFIMLWFLPALLSTVLLAALLNASGIWVRAAVLAVAVAVHLSVGALPVEARSMTPQGVLIALAMLPLGLAARFALPWLTHGSRRVWSVPLAVAILLAAWRFLRGGEIEVATLVLPTLARPLALLADDATDLAFLLILLAGAGVLARVAPLRLLGRHSLVVYLVHPLLYKPILAALAGVAASGGALLYWAISAMSVLCAAVFSLAIASVVEATPWLRRLVTPRDLRGWLPVAALATPAA